MNFDVEWCLIVVGLADAIRCGTVAFWRLKDDDLEASDRAVNRFQVSAGIFILLIALFNGLHRYWVLFGIDLGLVVFLGWVRSVVDRRRRRQAEFWQLVRRVLEADDGNL